jgi:O-antigen/teichoic acid export membrane protein
VKDATDSTVKPALLLMAGRGVAFLVTFLLPLALVRLFDPTQFGTYKQLFLVYGTLYNIGQLGMAESLFYFLPRARSLGGAYVANALGWLAAAGLGGLAALWAFAPAVARGLANPALAPHLPLLGLFLMLSLPAAALEIVMIARQRYARAALAYGASDVLRAAALLAPALIWRRLDWLLAGACGFAALRLVAALAYLRRELGDGLRPRPALQWEQLAYALPFAATVLLETAQVNYHHYAVSHRFDAATFAVYSIGCLQIPLMELVASPIANVMMVRMAERLREGRGEEAVAVWKRTTCTLALLFFPVTALLLVSARDLIVLLFTETYAASVPVFRVWSLALALSVLQAHAVLRVYAATRFMFVIGLLKLALVAALIGVFLTAFGLPGAVLVSLLAMLGGTAVMLARMGRVLGLAVGDLVPWRELGVIAVVSAAAALPAAMARTALPGPLLARLALTGLVYGVVYVAIVVQSSLLGDAERAALRGWRQRWTPAALRPGESRS